LAAGLCLDCTGEGFGQTAPPGPDGTAMYPIHQLIPQNPFGYQLPEQLAGVLLSSLLHEDHTLVGCTLICCWVDIAESFGAQRFCTFEMTWLILGTL
jgi:hypothetical protein